MKRVLMFVVVALLVVACQRHNTPYAGITTQTPEDAAKTEQKK